MGTGNKTYSVDKLLFIPNSEYKKGVIDMMNKLLMYLNDLNNSCYDVLDLTKMFNRISEPIFFMIDDI